MTHSMDEHKKRLEDALERFGSWRKVGEHYGVNHRFPYEFVRKGIMPPKNAAYKLGIIPTSVLATRERNEILNTVARRWGYKGWSAYETHIINKEKSSEKD